MKVILILTLLMVSPVSYGKFVPDKESANKWKKVPKSEKTDIARRALKAIADFKKASPKVKEALIAYCFGLTFTDGKESPYRNLSEALYVDSKGNVQKLLESLLSPGVTKDAIYNILYTEYQYSEKGAFFYNYADMVTKICRNTFKHRINELQPTEKYAWLAEAAGLLYTDDDTPSYYRTSENRITERSYASLFISSSGVSHDKSFDIDTIRARSGAKFLDSEGNEHVMKDIRKNMKEKSLDISEHLYWYANLIGKDDVLAVCSEELQALRQQRDKSGVSAGKEIKILEESPASDRTYIGKYPTGLMHREELVKIYKKLPNMAKEALIAAYCDLLFKKEGNSNDHFFVDSNAKIRNLNQIISRTNTKEPFDLLLGYLRDISYGGDIFNDITKNTPLITRICRNTIKYKREELPTEISIAWLAMTADLVYMKDGSSPYEEIGKHGTKRAKRNAKFIGPDGKERDVYCTLEKKEEMVEKLLYRCTRVLGEENVLKLYPEEVKVLREQFKKKDAARVD